MIIAWILGALISGLIGAICGNAKGSAWGGFWWGFFLGPIGWIIALLMPAKEAEYQRPQLDFYEREEARHAVKMRRLQEEKQRSAEQIRTKKWRIAKGTTDLGEMDLAAIKLKMRSGELTTDDLYFDEATQDWVTISNRPEFSVTT